MIGIYIPTYGRPKKLQAVADNIRENTYNPYQLYWGVETSDEATIEAAEATGHPVIFNDRDPKYADALQAIYESTTEPFMFPANDDFLFLKDWDKLPIEMLKADSDIQVLGVHDGNPSTSFSAVQFIRRRYIKDRSGVVDIPDRVFYPYNHNFIDNEMTETAQSRGVWAACSAPCIEHQHPSFTWLGDFATDDTYKKNDKGLADDSETYHSRKHLWS